MTTSPGLLLSELVARTAARTAKDRERLAWVLDCEVAKGRVGRDDRGCFRLIPAAFAPDVLHALRRIERPAPVRPRRPSLTGAAVTTRESAR